eukprot:1190292-Prorocentrum_minimum.AAC.2
MIRAVCERLGLVQLGPYRRRRAGTPPVSPPSPPGPPRRQPSDPPAASCPTASCREASPPTRRRSPLRRPPARPAPRRERQIVRPNPNPTAANDSPPPRTAPPLRRRPPPPPADRSARIPPRQHPTRRPVFGSHAQDARSAALPVRRPRDGANGVPRTPAPPRCRPRGRRSALGAG